MTDSVKKLNLGCGKRILKDWINLDKPAFDGVAILCQGIDVTFSDGCRGGTPWLGAMPTPPSIKIYGLTQYIIKEMILELRTLKPIRSRDRELIVDPPIKIRLAENIEQIPVVNFPGFPFFVRKVKRRKRFLSGNCPINCLMVNPTSVTTIVRLAFVPFLRGKAGKRLIGSHVDKPSEMVTESTLMQMTLLRRIIWNKLRGNLPAEQVLMAAERGSEAALKGIADYLAIVMKKDEDFATQLHAIIQDINIKALQNSTK